jgi:high affinity sulfate transporter 1
MRHDEAMSLFHRRGHVEMSDTHGVAAASAQSQVPNTSDRRSGALFSSLVGYQKSSVIPDLIAAITLLVIAVPEQLATSRLAGMPPITGFYAFIAGSVLFALLGSNPQMSVGADSTIAPLFAIGIAHLAATGSPNYLALVGILAVAVGALVALTGLLRLGWIAEFLSAPIITGFMAGVAIIIVIHQLPDLFGLASASGSNLHRVSVVAQHLSHTNGWALGIGVAVFAIVVGAERVDKRLPGALVGLVGSTVLVAWFSLQGHGVAVLGAVAHGAPHVGLSGLSWSALRDLLPLAGVVALVVISQSAATSRAFADEGHYETDIGRDFIGVGAGSIAAGLIGAFPVNASPARTAAVASSGGRTQAVGLGAAVVLVLLIPAAGLLKDVPLATLAAVLIYVATRIVHVKDLVSIAKFDLFEFGLAIVTLLTVAVVGVEQGIGVAVALAVIDRTRISARPQLHILGRLPGTTSWVPLSTDPHAAQVDGVLAVLFATPLWYANAAHFGAEMTAAMRTASPASKLVVLDAAGMNDLDYTGAKELREVLDESDKAKLDFAMARVGDHVRLGLQRSGLLGRIGEKQLYPSVDAAVAEHQEQGIVPAEDASEPT